jgi:hypothetical protein
MLGSWMPVGNTHGQIAIRSPFMKKRVRVYFDKLEYQDGQLVITDRSLHDGLTKTPSQTLLVLAEHLPPLLLEQITIHDDGARVIIQNPVFIGALRHLSARKGSQLGQYSRPPYVTNHQCGNSPMGNRQAYGQVTNYWCDEIINETPGGVNYYCV